MIDKIKPKNDNDIFAYTYNEGVAAFNCEDYKIALAKFLEAKELPDFRKRIFYSIALCYQNLNDVDSAIEAYNAYIEQKPYAYNALMNLFYIYYNMSDYENAVLFFVRCLKIHKDETIKSYFYSKEFNSDSKSALEFFEFILKIEDGKYLYMEMLKFLEIERVILDQTVSIAMVIDMYEQYGKYTNDKEDTEISIAMCYTKINDWEKAICHAQKAVVANPNSYVANKQLGFIYYCCAKYDKSIGYYQKAIELAPCLDYKLYSDLAYAYEKAEKLPEAIHQFEILLEKFQNVPAFYEIKYHTEYIKNIIYGNNKV